MNQVITSPQTQEEFEEYYKLRWKMLRAPWGEPKGSEQDELDKTAIHIMAMVNDRIVGCCRLQINTKEQAQVRYMAVDDSLQGKGIGRLMLKRAEELALNQGISEMMLETRDIAVEFYKRNGYQPLKKSYVLFGDIQHITMTKKLIINAD